MKDHKALHTLATCCVAEPKAPLSSLITHTAFLLSPQGLCDCSSLCLEHLPPKQPLVGKAFSKPPIKSLLLLLL